MPGPLTVSEAIIQHRMLCSSQVQRALEMGINEQWLQAEIIRRAQV